MKRPSILILVVVAGWFALPIVSNLIANIVSNGRPAPWESIVGVYFPDGTPANAIQSPNFASLVTCKNWISGMKTLQRSYSASSQSSSICGWGILRTDSNTGLPKMRDFIQGK